jgi:hypothetical protein
VPVLLVGGTVAIIFGAMIATDRGHSGSSSGSPAPAPVTAPKAAAPAPTEQPIGVTAEQLRKDYEANEVSADDRYRGKPLLVTGTLHAIKKDLFDAPYIELETSNQFEGVWAHFAKSDAGSLGKLSRGYRVTVRCIGHNVVMGSPQLEDCVLQ